MRLGCLPARFALGVTLISLVSCSPQRPDVVGLSTTGTGDPTPDTTAPTVTIEQKTGQADPATVDGIEFTVTFSEAIDATTLTTADITQNGTAVVETWGLTQLTASTWELSADVVRGSGTVQPSIAAARFADTAGNSNGSSSSSTDNAVTYNEPSATVAFTRPSSVVAEGTGTNAKTIEVTLSAPKSYDVVVGYVPVEAYTSHLGDTNLTPASYTVTIPAGDTTADLTYNFIGDSVADSPASKIVQVALVGANSNAIALGEAQIHRQLVQDDDGGHDAFVNVSAGVSHSCGITATGALYCWGLNSSGQLGDGTTTLRRSPVGVTQDLSGSADLSVGWTAISAGGAHTCGIYAGVLYCWGANASSQLGDTTTAQRLRPVEVDSGATYVAVSAGNVHTCGVTNTQDLKCWGNGGSGRLGSGATANVTTPTSVTLPDGFSATNVLAAGFDHTCVAGSRVCDPGTEVCPADPTPYIYYQLYCTGSDAYGQLGRSVGSGSSNSFVAVADTGAQYTSLSSSKSAADQVFSCGVADGSLKCWGRNNYNQLGDGSTTTRTSPMAIGTGYSSVSAGGAGACAVNQADELMCWGKMQAPSIVSIISSAYPSSSTPAATDSSEGYILAAAGGEHRCAITVGGILKCWGASTHGVLGDGSSDAASTPVEIDPGTTYASVTAGGRHTCARTGTGLVRCFGSNTSGQIGDGQSSLRTHPATISATQQYSSVAVGGTSSISGYFDHSCGIAASGALMCWGDNTSHQLGQGPAGPASASAPTEVDSGVLFSKLDVEAMNSCAITTTGVLKCWGDGSFGQIGTSYGDTAYDTPNIVDSGNTYTEVAVGGSIDRVHACGIRTNGDLYCWGANDYGQLGMGSNSAGDGTPNMVSGISSLISVSLGEGHSCAVDSSGALSCWGRNLQSQLGNEDTSDSANPVSVGVGYKAVSLGAQHSCAITETDELKCWGYNASGQVGDGTTSNAISPVTIDSGVDYVSVSLGDSHTCGVTSAGQLKCWGSVGYGLLGNGQFQSWKFPTPIW